MQSQLNSIREDLERALARVHTLGSQFSPEDWQRKPDAERWSAIQCIEHLNKTSKAYIERLGAALATASKENREKRYHLDLPGWGLVMILGSRAKWSRSKTNRSFVPETGPNVTATLQRFEEDQAQMLQLLDTARGKAIDTVKIESPFREGVRYHVYSAFRIFTVHQMRHLDQAERAARGL